MKRISFIIVVVCCFSNAHAQVALSEIMYAPPTSDDKHEWVEMCTSAESFESKDVKFFESNVAHALTLVRGVTLLSPGTCAVIADDATTFLQDFPNFSGTLFDSSFSLTNSGETLALRTGAGATLDSIAYTDANGAKDDGNSLHRTATASLFPGVATPGSEVGFAVAGVSSGASGDTGTTQANTSTATPIIQFHTVTIEPPPQLTVRVPEHLTVHNGTLARFTAEMFNAKGGVVEGIVRWSFGDGYIDTGKKVAHAYEKEGEYLVYVEGSAESLSDDAQIEVTVVPTVVNITVTESGDVSVHNMTDAPLDLTGSKLVSGYQVYVFPDGTRIARQATTSFPQSLTKLSELHKVKRVALSLPRLEKIAEAEIQTLKVLPELSATVPQALFSILPFGARVEEKNESLQVVERPSVTSAIVSGVKSETTSKIDTSQKNQTNGKIFGMHISELGLVSPVPHDAHTVSVNNKEVVQTATARNTSSEYGYSWVLALLGVLGIATIPIFITEPQASRIKNGDSFTADDFTIIDASDDDK
ncbi:MAG: PKD domain-containing protein [Minisyncoccia bacterium]